MLRVSRRRLLSSTLVVGASATSFVLLAACSAPAAALPTTAPAAALPTTAPAAALPTTAPAAPASATQAPTAQAAAGSTPTAVAPAFAPTQAAAAGVPGPELVVTPPKSPQPITLRFIMRSGGEKSEPAIYVDRPNEWKQATGNDIMLVPIPGDANYVPKVLTLAASNSIGDLLFTGDSYGEHHHMIQYGIIQQVDDYLATYHVSKDEWFKTTVDTLTVGGKMYGLPKASNPAESFVTINLKMFADAGITPPTMYGLTFDQITQWANQLSKGPPDNRDVYGYYTAVNSNQSITNGVRQRAGDLVGADGLHSLVDQDPFQQWLNWNYQLIVKNKVHPLAGVVAAGDSNALGAMFAAGKLAMAHSHRSWQFPFKNAIQDKFPWTTVQYPRGPGAIGWVSNVDTHSGASASKYKDEAFSLCYALADRRNAYLVGKTQGYLTARLDNVADLGALANDPFILLQQKNTEQEAPWWRAVNLRAIEVESTLTNTLDLVWLGKRQPDKSFTDDLKQAIDAVLAKPPL